MLAAQTAISLYIYLFVYLVEPIIILDLFSISVYLY